MPFRERAKKMFKSKARGDSLSNSSTNESNHDVYQPGEAMPPPKYRRPPQKEHKDKLEAFSFADAWRKRSFQSSRSPMGTRMSSRRTSVLSTHRKSVARKSMVGDDGGLGSLTNGEIEENSSRQQETVGGGIAPSEPGYDGDDEVANVGLPQSQSKEKGATSRPRTAEFKQPNGLSNGLYKTMGTAHDHQPFSEQDITNALQRGNVQVSAQS